MKKIQINFILGKNVKALMHCEGSKILTENEDSIRFDLGQI